MTKNSDKETTFTKNSKKDKKLWRVKMAYALDEHDSEKNTVRHMLKKDVYFCSNNLARS